MVARLQQTIVIAWAVLWLGWIGFWWTRSGLVAVLGAMAIALVHAGVLGIELMANFVRNARDSVPRAPARHYLRAWWGECRVGLQVFCWRQPFRSRSEPDRVPTSRRRGVLLVHGFLCNRGFWLPWLAALRRDDRAVIALDLEPAFASVDRYVGAIDDAIARLERATGLPPLVVCHSMGGLAVRAWLRGADARRLHRIVTIGTPHAGTWLARFSHGANGRQMRPGNAWLQQLAADGTGCDRVPFTCWYGDCDNVVSPPSSAMLPGADNRRVTGRAHVEMTFDAQVLRGTLALLDADPAPHPAALS